MEIQAGLPLHLTGQDDHRDGIGEGTIDTVQCIDGPRSGGQHHHGRLSSDAGITFRCHGAGLFMVHEGTPQLIMSSEGLVKEHRPAAGHAKNLFQPVKNEPVGDLFGNALHLQTAIEDGVLQLKICTVWAVDVVDGQRIVGLDRLDQCFSIHYLTAGQLTFLQRDR